MTVFQKIKRKNRDQKGFTLGELLIVVAIIGVLVSISIPIFADQKYKAEVAVTKANVRSLYSQMVASYLLDPSGQDPGCIKSGVYEGTNSEPTQEGGIYGCCTGSIRKKRGTKTRSTINSITVTLNNGATTTYKFYHLGYPGNLEGAIIWEPNKAPIIRYFYILDKSNKDNTETITYGK